MRRIVACLAILALSAFPMLRADAAGVTTTWQVGVEPFGVTIDPRDGRIYVAISDSQNFTEPESMYVIDPRAAPDGYPTLIALPEPQAMSVLDPALDHLFVTLGDGSVAVVDVTTGTMTGTIAGVMGLGIALDPATHHVFTVEPYWGASVIDGATGMVLAQVPSPAGDVWWSVAHDPTTHRLYVTNLKDGAPSLVVLDEVDLSLIANVPLPRIPRSAVSVDAAHGLVYVGGYFDASGPSGLLWAIDEASFAIVKTLDVGRGIATPIWTTLDAASGRLYVSDIAGPSAAGNELVVVDTESFTALERIPLSFEPGQSALSADGRLYVSGFDSRLLAAISTSDAAPVIDAVSLDPSSPATDDVVEARVQAHDPDGDPVSLSYRWYRNGALLSGASGPTLDLSTVGNGDRGDVLTVEVVASDGTLFGAVASASVTVVDSAPTVSVGLDDPSPKKTRPIVATAVSADVDGDPLLYTYTWYVNGKLKRTTVTTLTSDAFDLKVAEAEVGDLVTVVVVTTDGSLDASASASATVTPAGH